MHGSHNWILVWSINMRPPSSDFSYLSPDHGQQPLATNSHRHHRSRRHFFCLASSIAQTSQIRSTFPQTFTSSRVCFHLEKLVPVVQQLVREAGRRRRKGKGSQSKGTPM